MVCPFILPLQNANKGGHRPPLRNIKPYCRLLTANLLNRFDSLRTALFVGINGKPVIRPDAVLTFAHAARRIALGCRCAECALECGCGRADVPARLRGSRLRRFLVSAGALAAGLLCAGLLAGADAAGLLVEADGLLVLAEADGFAVVVFVLLVTGLVSLVLSSVLLSVEVLSSVLVSVLASSDFSSVFDSSFLSSVLPVWTVWLSSLVSSCAVLPPHAARPKQSVSASSMAVSFFIKFPPYCLFLLRILIRRITVRFCSPNPVNILVYSADFARQSR